ncbi:hypothetical protein D3C73_1211950 [compost metagenome]
MSYQGYQAYGIDPVLVERVKLKLKNPEIRERVKMIMHGVTKYDLQDRIKVNRLLGLGAKALGEKLGDAQASHIVDFVLAQKIDPKNTFHLIKLWSTFRS